MYTCLPYKRCIYSFQWYRRQRCAHIRAVSSFRRVLWLLCDCMDFTCWCGYIHVLYFYPDGLNLKSLTRTAVLDLVLDGDQKRPLSADNTPEHSAEVKTDATPASNSTNEPPDNDVQVPAGNSDTPSSPSPHITKSTPSPSSSSVPTTQPVIPPRPYRPPRPFPPPSSSPHPSSSSQSQHRNRTHKTTHGDPRSVLQPRDRLICALLSVSAWYILPWHL